MALSIKHQFVSLKGDGTDATQVQPSSWNAEHAATMGTGKFLGRLSAGIGAIEELTITAYMADLLTSADAATLAAKIGLFETGDVKYTFRATASTGWVLLQGGSGSPPNQIGNAGSSANLRANADTLALFTVIYNSCSDTVAPVSGGRTGNATNDFNSGKTLTIPQLVGRSPIGAGVATASTIARIIGTIYGAESTSIATANLPPYTPSGSISVTSVVAWSVDGYQPPGGGSKNAVNNIGPVANLGQSTNLILNGTFAGNAQGGTNQPLGILSPVTAMNVMVKL